MRALLTALLVAFLGHEVAFSQTPKAATGVFDISLSGLMAFVQNNRTATSSVWALLPRADPSAELPPVYFPPASEYPIHYPVIRVENALVNGKQKVDSLIIPIGGMDVSFSADSSKKGDVEIPKKPRLLSDEVFRDLRPDPSPTVEGKYSEYARAVSYRTHSSQFEVDEGLLGVLPLASAKRLVARVLMDSGSLSFSQSGAPMYAYVKGDKTGAVTEREHLADLASLKLKGSVLTITLTSLVEASPRTWEFTVEAIPNQPAPGIELLHQVGPGLTKVLKPRPAREHFRDLLWAYWLSHDADSSKPNWHIYNVYASDGTTGGSRCPFLRFQDLN